MGELYPNVQVSMYSILHITADSRAYTTLLQASLIYLIFPLSVTRLYAVFSAFWQSYKDINSIYRKLQKLQIQHFIFTIDIYNRNVSLDDGEIPEPLSIYNEL